MTQVYEACAPDGISRVVRWPLERLTFSPRGLRYRTFDVGEQLTADDLNPRTNIAALVAGGHLRPVAESTADESSPDEKEAV